MDFLKDRRHLGLHTEIFTDPLIDLIESGVVDNSTKKLFRGKSLATCCMGTWKLYDYIHDNPMVELYPSDMLLDPTFIGSNDNIVVLNLATEETLGGKSGRAVPSWTAFEGSSGDSDFMRGATFPKVADLSFACGRLPPRETNLILFLSSGLTPRSRNRGDANYVITEYGIAYLGGCSIRDRAMALIDIAHPDQGKA